MNATGRISIFAIGTLLAAGLTACNSSLSVSPNAATVNRSGAARLLRAQAAKPALLYVSDYQRNQVKVFSYPAGKPVATLTSAISGPEGLCSDSKGNVWVVNQSQSNVLEFARGGTKPIAGLSNPGVGFGCAIDPITGNLAVANYTDAGAGNIAIWKGARGKPVLRSDVKISHMFWCGYDNKGNLFVDGQDPSGAFGFAMLPNGKKRFVNITLDGAKIYYPGNVQWDGKYVAVGDDEYHGQSNTAGIYRTTGAGGKIIASFLLKGSWAVYGFRIIGSTLVAPAYYGGKVLYYKYPGGGSPTHAIKGLVHPVGAAFTP